MDERHSTPCTLVSHLLAWAQLVPGAAYGQGGPPPPPPIDAGGDDIFLIQASVAPNVILLMDTSASMNHIEWHPAFDPNADPTTFGCAAVDNATVYDYTATMLVFSAIAAIAVIFAIGLKLADRGPDSHGLELPSAEAAALNAARWAKAAS